MFKNLYLTSSVIKIIPLHFLKKKTCKHVLISLNESFRLDVDVFMSRALVASPCLSKYRHIPLTATSNLQAIPK